jgi:hypothetical protein
MHRSRSIVPSAAALVAASLANTAGAQCAGPKLVDDTPGVLAFMGATCDIADTRLVLGAPGFGASGRINIFERENGVWQDDTEFSSPLAPADDGYAQAVAMTEGYIAVGAPLSDVGGDTDTGRVYIYRRLFNIWVLDETIENPSPDDNDYFGHALDIRICDGTPVLAVGSPGDSVAGNAGAGRVRIFYRNGAGDWIFHSSVTSTDLDPDEFFGGAVALSDDRLVVGAPGEDFSGLTDAGAAYVYLRSGFSFNSGVRFLAPFGERDTQDVYGRTVAISGDRIAIGAPGDDQGAANDCGSICVYSFSGIIWSLEQRVLEPIPDAFNRLGTTIALSGDVLAAGIPSDEEAVIFRRDDSGDWNADQPLVAPDPPASGAHNFGSSVAISSDGEHLLVGDSGDDLLGFGNAGSAYLFTTDLNAGDDCLNQAFDPTPMLAPGTYYGCTDAATEGFALCAPSSADSWYQFTAPCNGILSLSTCGTHDLYGVDSGLDTVLSVQTGCPGGIVTFVACNDDAPSGNDPDACFLSGDSGALRDSALRLNVEAGVNYRVRIADYGAAGDIGQFILHVDFICCAVDWDANGVVNSTDVSAFINDWFEDQASGASTTDFNHDGVANSTDVSDFINAWLEGCGA